MAVSESSWKGVVVVSTLFWCFFISTGLSNTLGVFYLSFRETFQVNNAVTSWVGSLNYGMLCATGPVASLLVKRWGIPCCLVLGGCLSTVGYCCVLYCTNIVAVFIFAGIFAGFGGGLTFAACIFKVTLTFTRWRSLATGIAMAGVGVGHFVFPFVIAWLIELYSWRGAFLVVGAVQLHLVLCGVILHSDLASFQEKKPGADYSEEKQLSVTEDDSFPQSKPNSVHCNCQDLGDFGNLADSPVRKNSTESKQSAYWDNAPAQSKQIKVSITSKANHPTGAMKWLLFASVYISTLLFCYGFSIVLTHAMAFAVRISKFSTAQSASLLAVVGIASIFGKIALGAIAQLSFINIFFLYITCNVFSAISTLLYGVSTHYSIAFVVMLCFGTSTSSYGPVLNELLIAVVGIEDFSSAYGILMSAMAVGTMLGAPTAGWLYDTTHHYPNSFTLGAAAFLLDAVAVALAWLIKCVR